jgi:hypothetical protein
MSAYILDVEQIAALAAEAKNQSSFFNPITKTFIEYNTPASVAELLIRQNIRSVEARYPQYGEAGGLLNCPAEEYVQECIAAAKTYRAYNPQHELAALCDTYDYQSCETDDYHSTDAYWFINRVRHCAVFDMIHQLKARSAA